MPSASKTCIKKIGTGCRYTLFCQRQASCEMLARNGWVHGLVVCSQCTLPAICQRNAFLVVAWLSAHTLFLQTISSIPLFAALWQLKWRRGSECTLHSCTSTAEVAGEEDWTMLWKDKVCLHSSPSIASGEPDRWFCSVSIIHTLYAKLEHSRDLSGTFHDHFGPSRDGTLLANLGIS